MASFRLSGGLAGCFYGCVCYFGVTRCRQGIFPGGAAHIALIGCIAIFRTGRILMIYNFFVVIAENKYIVLICQIISVRIPIFHYDLHRLNAAFSQGSILIQAHAQKASLTDGNINAFRTIYYLLDHKGSISGLLTLRFAEAVYIRSKLLLQALSGRQHRCSFFPGSQLIIFSCDCDIQTIGGDLLSFRIQNLYGNPAVSTANRVNRSILIYLNDAFIIIGINDMIIGCFQRLLLNLSIFTCK